MSSASVSLDTMQSNCVEQCNDLSTASTCTSRTTSPTGSTVSHSSRSSGSPASVDEQQERTSTTAKAVQDLRLVQDLCVERSDGQAVEDVDAPYMPYSWEDLALTECFYNMADIKDSSPETLTLMLRAVMLMRSCGYHMNDVCLTLAYASMYYNDVITKLKSVRQGEAGYMMVLLMYLAHSYVLDESCPLKHWHTYLCRDYCDIKTLDSAVFGLMKMRGFVLRVDDKESQWRATQLYALVETPKALY